MDSRIPTQNDASPSMASLLGGIVNDIQTLIRQEMALAKSEITREWDKAKNAAGAMAVGSGVLALSGVLLCLTVVYAIHEAGGLPLWASYLIVGGVLGAVGAVLFYTGKTKASEVNVIPPQTAETMKENVEWMKNQT